MCAGQRVKGRGFDLFAVDGGTAGCVTCSTAWCSTSWSRPATKNPRAAPARGKSPPR